MKRTASAYALPVGLFTFLVLGAPGWAQDAAVPKLNIVIVEGDGAINNIKQRVNREPIVQVEDENHKPIAGALVVFFLPDQGPGGTFADGSHSMMVTTNAQGRAAMSGFRPNSATGQMQIRVTASFNGQTAAAVITQTMVAGGGGGGGGLSAAAKVWIVVGIAAGAGAGAFVALHGTSSSGSTGGGPNPITITAGQPTVGAPR